MSGQAWRAAICARRSACLGNNGLSSPGSDACTLPLSSSDSSQVNLPTWNFIFPSCGAGSQGEEHNSRDIASGLIACGVAAFAHEGARFGGLEFAANSGEAKPLSGTARL